MSDLHNVKSDRPQRAFLVGIQLPGVSDEDARQSLDELSRLVQTLGYAVVGRVSQKRSNDSGATVLGEGKLKELARLTGGPGVVARYVSPAMRKRRARIRENSSDESDDQDESGDESGDELSQVSEETHGDTGGDPTAWVGIPRPDVIVFDTGLTPSQIRNLESALGCDVLDRPGVIIEIFSRHARTRAARLQVEIARLTYLAPRILETGGGGDRQGGGVGAKGAGETEIELDRRRIRDRIKGLRAEFASIDREHETRRSRRSDLHVIALVGYTNAGKSSLMRALTGSEVLVADKLFATLETTVRPLHPPSVPQILISDTVGFIKKLPHDLVASFKSTLDEALNASLLLYVVDSSDAGFRSQLQTSKDVLAEVGAGDVTSLLVLNKIDRLHPQDLEALRAEFPEAIFLSTRSRDDVASLRERLIEFFELGMKEADVYVPYSVQGAIGEIRAQTRVLAEDYDEGGARLRIRSRAETITRLRSAFAIEIRVRE